MFHILDEEILECQLQESLHCTLRPKRLRDIDESRASTQPPAVDRFRGSYLLNGFGFSFGKRRGFPLLMRVMRAVFTNHRFIQAGLKLSGCILQANPRKHATSFRSGIRVVCPLEANGSPYRLPRCLLLPFRLPLRRDAEPAQLFYL